MKLEDEELMKSQRRGSVGLRLAKVCIAQLLSPHDVDDHEAIKISAQLALAATGLYVQGAPNRRRSGCHKLVLARSTVLHCTVQDYLILHSNGATQEYGGHSTAVLYCRITVRCNLANG